MVRQTKRSKDPEPVFKVGERVCFSLVHRTVEGIVTEDRGALASDGRHLFQVTVKMQPDEPDMVYELTDVELSRAAARQ